jgi:hypothetical protein
MEPIGVDPDFEIVLQSIQRDINWCVRRSLAHTDHTRAM